MIQRLLQFQRTILTLFPLILLLGLFYHGPLQLEGLLLRAPTTIISHGDLLARRRIGDTHSIRIVDSDHVKNRNHWRARRSNGCSGSSSWRMRRKNRDGEKCLGEYWSSNHPTTAPLHLYTSSSRRAMIHAGTGILLTFPLGFAATGLPCAAVQAPVLSPSITTSTLRFMSPQEAKITDKVYMKVRISRSDGTFYVRDDLPDTEENRVFQGTLVLELFGNMAPTSVRQFLSYVDNTIALDDESLLPTYGRSYFPSVDPVSGLLIGGMIPTLQLVSLTTGGTALQYGSRLLPSPLWLEPPECTTRVSHTAQGLLTHRNLDATPVFGITTRSNASELDRSHTVFGQLSIEKGEGQDFLRIVQELPTYHVDRNSNAFTTSISSTDDDSNIDSVVDQAATNFFNAQRSFFRKTARALGDTRIDKVYDGKILRRIEVTQAGRL